MRRLPGSSPRRRGFSLVEVLMASIVLPTGLVGTLYLLGSSVQVGRDADVALRATQFGAQTMMEYESMGYDGLKTETKTVGVVTHDTPYSAQVVTVVDAVAFTATVSVTVNWSNSHGQAQSKVFNGIFSRPPLGPTGAGCTTNVSCSSGVCTAGSCT